MTNRTKGLMAFTTIIWAAACAFAGYTGDDAEIYRTYGYDMCEDYYVARKQAIRDHKLLFVLSGSTSCNYCTKAKNYLYSQAEKIDPRYVCYYAKKQNLGGKSPFQGGLPQYGTYDPRTVDAFTGCYDASGIYQPQLAWYTGSDNAFLSYRGFGESLIDQCLEAAETKTDGKAPGNFVRFRLVGPDTVIEGTPTKYVLYADFDDDVTMIVDHGIKWTFDGKATIDAKNEGFVTASGSQSEIKIICTNSFYDFGTTANVIEKTVKVTSQSAVREIEIDTTPYNLEDNPKVVLRAKAILNDGTETEIVPMWTAYIKEFVDLPDGVPLAMRTDGIEVEMVGTGEVRYKKEENKYYGIDTQDHILEVTATAAGKQETREIRVYGPSRAWVSAWSIPTDKAVAPGSVIKANVTEIKYTYKGGVVTTNDLKYADFRMDVILEGAYSRQSHEREGLMIDIPANFDMMSASRARVQIAARRKGGKYTGFDYAYPNGGSTDQRTLTFKSATSYVEDRHGIRVNNGWAAVHFPGQTFDRALLDADADNDGYTNGEEFMLGTDPNDATDCWKFTACHFDWPDDVYYRVMFMNTQYPGRIYTIQGKENWNDDWTTLGIMKGEEPGAITESNVAKADSCHYFRVRADFDCRKGPWSDEPFCSGLDIPGLGVYTGPEKRETDVVIKPKSGEKYPAFAVDANKTKYPIYVDMELVEGKSTPLFSVTTTEVEPGQLDRFVPTAALQREGWYLTCTRVGIWANFYATKTAPTVKNWSEVKDSTAYTLIPGLAAADAAQLTAAQVLPTKFAQWASGKGATPIGTSINLDCFILNAANATTTPELVIDADDLAAILAAKGNLDAAAQAIKPKYPNAKIVVKDVTKEVCGEGATGVQLYRLMLTL